MTVRPREQRVKDALEELRTQVDAWVATANGAGKPYLVPLSFYWNGEVMIVTTDVPVPGDLIDHIAASDGFEAGRTVTI